MNNGMAPQVDETGVSFTVWAPKADRIDLYLPEREGGENGLIPMARDGEFWKAHVPGAGEGTRYLYRIDGNNDRPDPASRSQPDGVHSSSEVVTLHHQWHDNNWRGMPLEEYVLYEIHVGTYTEKGTFEAIIPHLDELKELGVTAIELMPIAQFPGERNWGYDGVYSYAVQHSYGGMTGLARLVDAAHQAGIAVILDVVYNHLGPEGNYLDEFGYYFTDCFKTPWGRAINYTEAHSRAVRDFFIHNALYWINEFHIDALRLDATHYIIDHSAFHFLEEMAEKVDEASKALGRSVYLIAEEDTNDPRYVTSRNENGLGMHGQWLDDYHHSLYILLAGTKDSVYEKDFGRIDQFAKAYTDGFVYSGEYCVSRQHCHGRSSRHIPGQRFVTFIQNHDQVGNKPDGRRLASEISFESQKVAAGAYILSPYLPLLFMGEEYGETRPFHYFTDHSDQDLINQIREGRAREFGNNGEAREFMDSQSDENYKGCILSHNYDTDPTGNTLRNYYKRLLQLRRETDALRNFDKSSVNAFIVGERSIVLQRTGLQNKIMILINFSETSHVADIDLRGDWHLVLNSTGTEWAGGGLPIQTTLNVEDAAVALDLPGESLLVYSSVV